MAIIGYFTFLGCSVMAGGVTLGEVVDLGNQDLRTKVKHDLGSSLITKVFRALTSIGAVNWATKVRLDYEHWRDGQNRIK